MESATLGQKGRIPLKPMYCITVSHKDHARKLALAIYPPARTRAEDRLVANRQSVEAGRVTGLDE